MTVPATTRKAGPYAGNGVTTQFPFSFKVFDATGIQPVLTDANGAATNLVLNSDYSVLLNADQDANPGGTVTYPIQIGQPNLPLGSTFTIIGGMSIDQLSDITNMGRFLPQVFEDAYDKLTILIQQIKEVSDRTLQAAVGTTVKLLFPAPSSGKFIRWRTDLLGLENVDAGTDSIALQGLLGDAGDATHGSGMIGYLLNAVGAVGRTLSAKLRESISAKDFGAVGDSVADDTLALQACINFCVANQLEMYVPAGTYKHSGLTVSGGLTMRGAGRYLTLFRYTVLSGVSIAIDCQAGVRFSGITFAHMTTPTGGQGISLTASLPGQVNQWSIFRDCSFDGLVDCIKTTKAMTWIIDNCIFSGYTGTAVHVQNDDNGDGGDSTIHGGCIFAGIGPNSVAIHQVSSGGLKIANNKIVAGAYGYLMTLGHTVQTGDLLITGNSIENLTVSGIQMNRIAGGILDMHFSNVTIVGNQFLGTATGVPILLNDADPNWLLGVTIVGNQLDLSHAGASPYGIYVNAVNSFNITGNTILGQAGVSAGIRIEAIAVGGDVGRNTLVGLAIGIQNFSPSTSVAKKVVQGTTTAVTCSTPSGAVYQGALAVLFPVNLFGATPIVTVSVAGGANGIGGGATSVSAIGFTAGATASTNGANVVLAWRAEADY